MYYLIEHTQLGTEMITWHKTMAEATDYMYVQFSCYSTIAKCEIWEAPRIIELARQHGKKLLEWPESSED